MSNDPPLLTLLGLAARKDDAAQRWKRYGPRRNPRSHDDHAGGRYWITSSAVANSVSDIVKAEGFGGEVDDQLEFRRLLHRQIGRVLAFAIPPLPGADISGGGQIAGFGASCPTLPPSVSPGASGSWG
jgi:hypothetical protein